MEHRRIGRDLFIRLDKGEELHTSIRSLSEHGIRVAALISGIGRVRNTAIGFLDMFGTFSNLR